MAELRRTWTVGGDCPIVAAGTGSAETTKTAILNDETLGLFFCHMSVAHSRAPFSLTLGAPESGAPNVSGSVRTAYVRGTCFRRPRRK